MWHLKWSIESAVEVAAEVSATNVHKHLKWSIESIQQYRQRGGSGISCISNGVLKAYTAVLAVRRRRICGISNGVLKGTRRTSPDRQGGAGAASQMEY